MSIFNEIASSIDKAEYGTFYEDPPSFAEFVSSPKYLGQQPLFERQKRVLFEALGPDPATYFSEDKQVTTIVLEWGKGCVTADTQVLTSEGSVVITDLSGSVVAFDESSGSLVDASASDAFVSGYGPIFRVETASGLSIDVFEGHMFYSGVVEYLPLSRGLRPGWRAVGDLSVGDYVRCLVDGDLIWDRIVLIKYIKHDYYYDLEVAEYQSYIANGFVSHNSGKDLVTSYLIAYFVYLLLNIRHLHDYLGIARDDYVDVIVVAASAKQATNTLFRRISKWLQRPIFQQFNPKILSQEIHFDVGLRIFSFHSKAETYEGYSPIIWAMAEACLTGDTLVQTEYGFRPIQEIVAGDKVWTSKGLEPVLATRAIDNVSGELARVSVRGVTDVRCTPDHKFLVYYVPKRKSGYWSDGKQRYSRNWKHVEGPIWVAAKDLTEEHFVVVPKRSLATHQRISPDLAKLMAWYITDGFMYWSGPAAERNPIGIFLSFGGDNLAYLEAVDLAHRLGYTNVKVKEGINNHGSRYRTVRISDRELGVWLLENVGSRAHDKKIPFWMLTQPDNVRHAFWEGWQDGTTKGRTRYYSTNNKDTALMLVALAAQDGVSPGLHIDRSFLRESSYGTTNPTYYVSRQLDSIQNFDLGDVVLLPVKSVTFETSTELVYDLETTGDFCVPYVVHNSAFRDSAEKSNAEHVFSVLSSSARSRFRNRWLGFVTSYPRGEGDFIERSYETSQRRADWWGDKAASWEVRDDRTLEDYRTDLEEMPEFAWTVYGCKPSTGFGKWFGDRQALKAAFEAGLRPEVVYRPIRTSRTTSSGSRDYLGIEILSYYPRSDYSYIAHGDPGLATDSFSFTIARLGPGVDRDLGLPVVDVVAIITWLPDKRRGLAVDFVNVKDVIIQLDRVFAFSQVTFDQWNSAMLIQQLMDAGVNAFDLSFSNVQQTKMYRNLRTMVNNGLVRIVPNDLAFQELRDLTSTSSKPDHPEGGSKDIADGIAAVCWFIAQEYAKETNGFVEFLKRNELDRAADTALDDGILGITPSGLAIKRRV